MGDDGVCVVGIPPTALNALNAKLKGTTQHTHRLSPARNSFGFENALFGYSIKGTLSVCVQTRGSVFGAA